MRPTIRMTLLLIACAVPALAEVPSRRMSAILNAADSPAGTRARLLACADSASTARDEPGEGEALSLAASSFQREGQIDSAIICHRRAFELLAASEELFALVDQLLFRRSPDDIAEAIQHLTRAGLSPGSYPMVEVTGRLAWARSLAGQTDSAATLFALVRRHLLPQPEWRYRMARVALARQDYRETVDLLLPVAARSRGTDQEVLGMIEEAGKALGMLPRIQNEVGRMVLEQDRSEVTLANALGGRLVSMPASDGFPLGGLFVPPLPATSRSRPGSSSKTRPGLAAIVLMAPRDTLGSADSLAMALRRHGVTTLLLYPRGSGGSVGPGCPAPDAWFNREAALQVRVAADVRDALRGLARLTRVDTTRYLVVAEGPAATMTMLTAALDPRVKALLLASPAPSPVDRGPMRELVARLRLPVFFQITPEEYEATYEITDILYQAGNRGASRVVETSAPGHGFVQFRSDPALAARFLNWLDAAFRPAVAPRAPGSRVPPRPTRPAPHR